jgi:predicted esterase
LLYVPANYTPDHPTALALLLHGAGGVAEYALSILQGLADEHNLLLLAPASRRQTWDMLVDEYGPDVTLIDQALDHVFTRYNVDAARVAIGGFSDGASYALSLGITNGDLFTYIMAFSPGYMAPAREAGKPRIFISHGTRDDVLPIDACSRKIVPRLENDDYNVRYREFDGPHTVPPEMTAEAVAWFKE